MKRTCVVLLLALAAGTGLAAETRLLAPEEKRITDEAIMADWKAFADLQRRLAAVNSKGTAIDNYHFAKAQAWLDFAADEYTQNDRTTVSERTLQLAQALIVLLEQGAANISKDTYIIPESMKVRPDLWEKVVLYKRHKNFPCVEADVARFEVQLVHAGHEEKEMGWRHAKPYLQAAERMARTIDENLPSCRKNLCADALSPAALVQEKPKQPVTKPLPKPEANQAVPSLPVPAPAASVTVQKLKRIPDSVHFAVNSTAISPKTAEVLKQVAAVMNGDRALAVELRGHADGRGKKESNLKLSRKRAENIRVYLVKAGVAAERIRVKAVADQVLKTATDAGKLAHDRRVEFIFSGAAGIELREQREDLQVEEKKNRRK